MPAGRLREIIGKIMLGIALLSAIILKLSDGGLGEVRWVLVICFSIFLGWGASIIYKSKQLRDKERANAVFDDGTPKVLYLRSFSADTSSSDYVANARDGDSIYILTGRSTSEEQLTDALRPFGELIAIGKPGEELPTPGAVRQYVGDDWQQKVTTYMKTANLVVVNAGNGANLLWEIKTAFDIVEEQKLLIYLEMKREHYKTFKKKVEHLYPFRFPESNLMKGFGKITGFIMFKEKQPVYLPLKHLYFRGRVDKPLLPLLQNALKPVFEANNVPWRKPPLSVLQILSYFILVLIFGTILFFIGWRLLFGK